MSGGQVVMVLKGKSKTVLRHSLRSLAKVVAVFLAGYFLFAVIELGVPLAQAANSVDTREYLEQFHRDPKKVMNAPLPRKDETGALHAPESYPIGTPLSNLIEVVQAKNALRDQLCRANPANCLERDQSRPSDLAAIGEFNAVRSFLYEPVTVEKLLQMEKMNLLRVALPIPPWTDSYWPTYKGLIARRWLDSSFPNTRDWLQNFTYVQMVPAVIAPIGTLSPAEKYDLLVGDPAGTLTAKMWDLGRYHQETKGSVPIWIGLCHGWAPASFMTLVPKRSVTLVSTSGLPIQFYPSDIKALASLAWGEAPPKMKFVGTRCKVADPKEDEYGRVLEPSCFDVNPATWHIGIVNQLGVAKRSFIFDATYDQQVWNYPINSYHYHYFNPQTLAVSEKLAGSMVNVADFTIDKFRNHRSPLARYVVGIAMEVSYAIPTQPSATASTKSKFHTVKYVYDLELDPEGNIIGGEWYSNFHPDFIWNSPPDGRALSAGEKLLNASSSWDGVSPFPEELRQAALISSAKSQPLAAVVEALVKLSQ